MANIAINDLEMNQELDNAALKNIMGGRWVWRRQYRRHIRYTFLRIRRRYVYYRTFTYRRLHVWYTSRYVRRWV